MVDRLAVELIADADLDLVEAVEDVELGQGEPIDPRGPRGLSYQHGIKPAAAPLAPGVDAELLAAAADFLTNLVVQLGRERPESDAGGVGLADAKHVADRTGANARSGRGLRR